MFKKTKYIIFCRFSFNLCEIEPENTGASYLKGKP